MFLIVGLGQYPNLGVMDAFAVLRRGDDHIVARMSKALGADRTDTTVGPLRIEVLEGLQKLRVVLEPGSEYDLSFDITFDATIPAALEPKHFRRQLERVTFDTSRFLQTGTWTGSLTVDGEDFAIDRRRGEVTATARGGVCVRSVKPNRKADAPSTESRTSSGSTRSCSSTSSRSR